MREKEGRCFAGGVHFCAAAIRAEESGGYARAGLAEDADRAEAEEESAENAEEVARALTVIKIRGARSKGGCKAWRRGA